MEGIYFWQEYAGCCFVLLCASYQAVHDVFVIYYGDVNSDHSIKVVSATSLLRKVTIFPFAINTCASGDTLSVNCFESINECWNKGLHLKTIKNVVNINSAPALKKMQHRG